MRYSPGGFEEISHHVVRQLESKVTKNCMVSPIIASNRFLPITEFVLIKKDPERNMVNGKQNQEEEFEQFYHHEKTQGPRGTKSPIQDKPKGKHSKTHTNQTNKD